MPPSSTSTRVDDGALVGHEVGRGDLGGGGRDARGFLLDLEQDRVLVGDLRRDLQDVADFLALDGLERVDRAAGCRPCW